MPKKLDLQLNQVIFHQMQNNSIINQNGIVLYAKSAGQTSFSSLFTIKHALKTKKVGHTILVIPSFCTPSGTRTLDPLIKSQLLYQLS